MKFATIALVATSAAVKLQESPDCPESTQVFSYNERRASAAGLAQNSLAQFATGMNGDEDLGQNIIMKGDKYHYNQHNNDLLVQFATGMNGDEDLGQNIIMKGDKYHYDQKELVQTGFAT